MVDESILANKASHMHSLEERAKFKPIRFLQCIIFLAGGALLVYLWDLFYNSVEVPWYLSIPFYLLYVGLSIGLVLVGVVFFGFDMLVKAVLDPALAKLTSRFVAAFLAMFVVPLLFGPLHKTFAK